MVEKWRSVHFYKYGPIKINWVNISITHKIWSYVFNFSIISFAILIKHGLYISSSQYLAMHWKPKFEKIIIKIGVTWINLEFHQEEI